MVAPRESYVTKSLASRPEGPVIAATDYMKLFADQIRAAVPRPYIVLGTDGFGRSDTRANLREFFEVDSKHVVVAALNGLVQTNAIDAKAVQAAIEKLGIEQERLNPARS
jgi:pyruvate dehydrogenase E1 component